MVSSHIGYCTMYMYVCMMCVWWCLTNKLFSYVAMWTEHIALYILKADSTTICECTHTGLYSVVFICMCWNTWLWYWARHCHWLDSQRRGILWKVAILSPPRFNNSEKRPKSSKKCRKIWSTKVENRKRERDDGMIRISPIIYLVSISGLQKFPSQINCE